MGLSCSKSETIREPDSATIATRDLLNILLRLRYFETNKIIAELKTTKQEMDDSSYNSLDWDLSALLMSACEKIDKLEVNIIKLRASLIDIYTILDNNNSEAF